MVNGIRTICSHGLNNEFSSKFYWPKREYNNEDEENSLIKVMLDFLEARLEHFSPYYETTWNR